MPFVTSAAKVRFPPLVLFAASATAWSIWRIKPFYVKPKQMLHPYLMTVKIRWCSIFAEAIFSKATVSFGKIFVFRILRITWILLSQFEDYEHENYDCDRRKQRVRSLHRHRAT